MDRKDIAGVGLVVFVVVFFAVFRIVLYRDDPAHRVRVVSEFLGMRVTIADKKQLMTYLADFGFWNGVITDYRTSSAALSSVVPRELVIHVTPKDYPENRMEWTNGVLIGSTNLTAQPGNSIHVWIGINPDYAKKYPSSVGPMLEYFLVKTLAYRTITRHIDGETVTPISFRERKTYVFSAQKQ